METLPITARATTLFFQRGGAKQAAVRAPRLKERPFCREKPAENPWPREGWYSPARWPLTVRIPQITPKPLLRLGDSEDHPGELREHMRQHQGGPRGETVGSGSGQSIGIPALHSHFGSVLRIGMILPPGLAQFKKDHE